MLGNGIKQTTATTGTGNLTLAAVAGFRALSDSFALGQPFAYALVNASGAFVESGIGYLVSATEMVRARISATATSEDAPTAASLTGTTTIIATPNATTLEAMLPTVDGQTAGINRMVTTAHRNTAVTSQAMTALRLSYVPFLLRTGGIVNSLSINVGTAAVAGKLARLGLYACNEKGYPGPLMVSTADFAVDAVGLKTNSVGPIFLPPGWYFAASVSDGAPTIFMHTASAAAMGGGPFGFSGTSPVDFRYEVLVDTNMPSTANTATTAVVGSAQHLPMVYVGLA